MGAGAPLLELLIPKVFFKDLITGLGSDSDPVGPDCGPVGSESDGMESDADGAVPDSGGMEGPDSVGAMSDSERGRPRALSGLPLIADGY